MSHLSFYKIASNNVNYITLSQINQAAGLDKKEVTFDRQKLLFGAERMGYGYAGKSL